MCFNTVNSYQELPINRLQQIRLYYQARPLLQLWHAARRKKTVDIPVDIDLINQELDQNYIAVDCAGWYFSNSTRHCTAIELHNHSSKYWHNIHFEYDYLTWRPDYLHSGPVLAYYSEYFKYSTMDDFVHFCNIWSMNNSKLIVGVDPSKIQFNYLKFNLVELLQQKISTVSVRVLGPQLFVITRL
jgi:hypothetical protein